MHYAARAMGGVTLRQKKEKNYKVKVVINQIFGRLQHLKNECVQYASGLRSGRSGRKRSRLRAHVPSTGRLTQ